MNSFSQNGVNLPLVAPYDRSSGQGAKVGKIFGVAATDVLSGATAEFMTEGVHYLAKATGAISQGDKLFWDDSAKNLTKTAAGNMVVGYATADAASGDAKCYVKLNGDAPSMSAGVDSLTDNSGGATADGTIGAVTLPDLSAWNGSTDPTAAQATAIRAAITALTDAVKELSTKINSIVS